MTVTSATGPGIAVHELAKNFGEIQAVRGLTFTAAMGSVTGFVGANGAGKTTTIRMLLGLVEPTSGAALIDGRRMRDIRNPRSVVGVVLDTPGAHPGYTARAHLRIVAAAAGIPAARTTEVLDLVGLGEAANRRVGAFSLGMKQRLSLATALLGDPRILMLDEPTKGLDPPGMLWLRGFLRDLAAEGRCVFLSSHHLAELDAIADDVVVLDKGRLVARGSMHDVLRRNSQSVLVATPRAGELADLLLARGAMVTPAGEERLRISGLTAAQVGDLAALAGVALHHLTDERLELEDIFVQLTSAQPGSDRAEVTA